MQNLSLLPFLMQDLDKGAHWAEFTIAAEYSNKKSNLHYTRLIRFRVSRVSSAHLQNTQIMKFEDFLSKRTNKLLLSSNFVQQEFVFCIIM